MHLRQLCAVVAAVSLLLSHADITQGAPDADAWRVGGAEYARSRALSAADFGLTPNTTDDQTSILNDAIVSIDNDPDHDTLYIPRGTYLVAGHLRLRPGVNLIGDGIGNTIIERRDESHYLLWNKRLDGKGAVIANLTLNNRSRTVMLQRCRNIGFHQVEFVGGIVRLEDSSDITFSNNLFNENIGKAAYASAGCKNITITHNRFNSISNGSINLSGHTDCYVAFNHITSAVQIDSGYAGIRLPNGARNNLVENNLIENHGRGLFVLSSSTHNTLRGNIIRNSRYQSVFVQSSDNVIQGNVIIDAGSEAIYLVDATAEPTPSVANRNRVVGNTIYDTRAPTHTDRHFALRILSTNNTVQGNVVSTSFGRTSFQIAGERGNQVIDNVAWQDAQDYPDRPRP